MSKRSVEPKGAATIKPPPRKGWGATSNCAAFDPRLTDACCRVYMALCCWGGKDRRVYHSVGNIASNMKLGEATVKRAIGTLSRLGYISVTANPSTRTGRTIHIEHPPRFVSEEDDVQSGEDDEEGITSEPPGGSPADPGGITSEPRGDHQRAPIEEPPDKNSEEKNLSEQPAAVLTLCEPHADGVRDELRTILEEVPALRGETGKRRGEWVHKAARWFADVYSDGHSLGRYHKLFWTVVGGGREAAEILRAFDTVDADSASGKLRGVPGPYFFGVLETGYDGDRRLSEESEAQADAGLSRAPVGNWDDPHEPTSAERAVMRESLGRKPTADESREKLLRQYEWLRAAEAAKTGG